MINPIFKITNPVAKIESMKSAMVDMVEFMDSYDFFEYEDIKADETINAIKNEDSIIRDYVVEKIVSEAYNCDYLLSIGLEYDEAMTIAKYLILKED